VHITHELADVVSADRVLVLDGGRQAFAGTLAELLVSPDVLDCCGLELPALHRLAGELASRGAPVPDGDLTPETIAGALWG
jgi:hypothetical protein